MMLTFGSLFAGVGGFDAGFESAGLTPRWQVEIDPECRRVLTHHWPAVPQFVDVRECGAANLAPVDIVCGGFPCQNLSVAGKRGGIHGDRSGLFFEMCRIVRELRPALLIWENVPGLLSGKDEEATCDCETPDPDSESICGHCGHVWTGMGAAAGEPVPWMGTVLRELSDSGLVGGWRTVDSQFYGVPQRRRRVFGCFACLDPRNRIRLPTPASWDDPRSLAGLCAQILALGTGGKRHPAKGRAKRKDVAAALTRGTATGRGVNAPGRRREDDVNLAVMAFNWQAAGKQTNLGFADVSSNLHVGQTPAVVYQANGAGAERTGEPTCAASDDNGSNQVVVEAFQCIGSNVCEAGTLRQGNGGLTGGVPFIVADEPVSCIKGAAIGRSPAAGPQRGFIAEEGIGTIRAEGENRESRPTHTVLTGTVVRRLTPVECLRLQGFADTHLDIDPPLSDSAKYRMCGNAVTRNVAQWIGRRIITTLETT